LPYRGGNSKVTLLQHCRELRRSATNAETLLWHLLRNRALGVKFRRQHQLGAYIADFFCAEKQLVVETDGVQHQLDEGLSFDADRTAFLDAHGIQVLRFTNLEVWQNTEEVLSKIWDVVNSGYEIPSP